MKRYVYMNDEIRKPKPKKPVIVVQSGKRLRNTNHVEFRIAGRLVGAVRFLRGGLRSAPKHSVRAFIELEPEVEISL